MLENKPVVGQRECPLCKVEIVYTTFAQLKIALRKNTYCRKCKNSPKEMECPSCKTPMTYKTIKPLSCKLCLKKRRLEEAGSKKCSTPTCNNIIYYSSKWERQIGEENKTACPSCAGKSQNRAGKTNYDIWIEKGMCEKEAASKWRKSETKRLATRKGYVHSEETKRKIGLKSLGRFVSEINRKNTSERNKRLIAEGKLCGINKTKRFLVNNITCQGSYEKMYIESLVSKSLQLPNNVLAQLTPIGNYLPDFEYPDRFVEIKGKFTYEVFCQLIQTRYKSSYNQREKVIWVGTNIKPVQLLVLDKKGNIIKEEWYTPLGVEIKIDLLKK